MRSTSLCPERGDLNCGDGPLFIHAKWNYVIVITFPQTKSMTENGGPLGPSPIT
jgi:hypothetical protein